MLVNVGALVGHKGQKFLVEAMAQVRRQVPDAQLVIFGEGDLREPLSRQIRDLGLDKHVVLAGFRDDVHALTRSAELFVMSSVTEGLGSAVLDAMALGLPVVGTRAGGIPEAVDDGVTGLLVPPGRADALAEAIVRMLNDPAARQRMGDAGRARVEAEFGVDRLVEGTLATYRQRAGAESNLAGSQLAAPARDCRRAFAWHIAEIWRYPVKSMAGEPLAETTRRSEAALDGDRRLHVEDRRGRVITARTHPRLLGHHARTADDGTVLVDGQPWYDPGGRRRGRRHRRRRRADRPLADGVFDILPLLVATDGAIAAFGYDGRRLRPNLVIGGVSGLDERGWEGHGLRIGEVRHRPGRPARPLRDDDLRSRYAGPGSRRAEVDRAPLRRLARAERRRGRPGPHPRRRPGRAA